MSNPCRLDDTTQNKIAYAIGYENGRADVIEELKPYVLTNMDREKFLWLKVDELNKLSFAEKLKEQTDEMP